MITTESYNRMHAYHMNAYQNWTLAGHNRYGKEWHLEQAARCWRAIVFRAGSLG